MRSLPLLCRRCVHFSWIRCMVLLLKQSMKLSFRIRVILRKKRSLCRKICRSSCTALKDLHSDKVSWVLRSLAIIRCMSGRMVAERLLKPKISTGCSTSMMRRISQRSEKMVMTHFGAFFLVIFSKNLLMKNKPECKPKSSVRWQKLLEKKLWMLLMVSSREQMYRNHSWAYLRTLKRTMRMPRLYLRLSILS